MPNPVLQESAHDPAHALWDVVCPAGEPWMGEVLSGQTVRIVDLKGNQAVDTLFYNRHNRRERYSAQATIVAQRALYLTTGSVLMSSEGRPMLTIVADTCGRHDTLGGACSAESNTVRYGHDKGYLHSCRDNFLHASQHCACGQRLGLGKRDLASNINFFMNVPVEGRTLRFADGVSAPGKYVEMRAEQDVVILISNCPQLNNPCNAYDPTPIRIMAWEAAED